MTKQFESLILDTDSIDATIKEAVAGEPGHVVEVTLITAGASTNGNYYSDDVLRQAAPLFEGARAFADHQPARDLGQPRSVRDLVGHYRNVRHQGGRVRGDLRLLPGNDWLWAIICEAENHPDLCGLSIDAKGEVRTAEVDGKRVRVVESIRRVNSVDIVSRPAAGGSIDRIIAGELPEPESPDLDVATIVAEAEPVASDHGDGIADERPDMGPDPATLSDLERKRFATVIQRRPDGTVHYSFPIPPRGHPGAISHARVALARLDQSDLTDVQKAKVRARAHAVLTAHAQHAKEAPMTETAVDAPDHLAEVTAAEEPDLTATIKTLLEEKAKSDRELAQLREALIPNGPAPVDPNASAVQLLEQIKQERDQERCARILESALGAAALPAPISERLRNRFTGTVFSELDLSEEIKSERDVLAALSTSGQVTGHSFEKGLTVGMSEYEQLQAAFDKMFDVSESEAARAVPSITGIRQAYRIATGRDISTAGGLDAPLLEAYREGMARYVRAKVDAGTLQESELHLLEADVTTSTFSYLLGTSMNKRLLKDYQAWPSEWQKFVNTVAIKDFKAQDRIRLGAFGSLSTVAEDAAYTTLTLADTHATYTPTKRGNLVQISRETIINDDLYAIKQIPQKLAVAAAFTLAEFIYGLLDPSFGNIYDGHSLFDATNHKNTGITSGNIGTANSGAALSSAAMQTGVIAMRKQTNAASKPIGLKPRFLLVPPDLEFTAMNILKSAGLPGGSNNDINPMMGYAEPIIAPQCNSFPVMGATTTYAALIADPRVIDTLEVGFIGGQVNPVLFIQDQPLYGINFTQDVISYKVRHEYGGAVVDYRGFYLINN